MVVLDDTLYRYELKPSVVNRIETGFQDPNDQLAARVILENIWGKDYARTLTEIVDWAIKKQQLTCLPNGETPKGKETQVRRELARSWEVYIADSDVLSWLIRNRYVTEHGVNGCALSRYAKIWEKVAAGPKHPPYHAPASNS